MKIDRKRKRLRRKEKLFENSLTETQAAVRCAASVETKDLIETLFNN
jgi:hypothetical protein